MADLRAVALYPIDPTHTGALTEWLAALGTQARLLEQAERRQSAANTPRVRQLEADKRRHIDAIVEERAKAGVRSDIREKQRTRNWKRKAERTKGCAVHRYRGDDSRARP